MAWAYVGLDGCGISATNAAKLERAQAKLARSILAAPRHVPIPVLLGELGWTTVTLKFMKKVLVEWGRAMSLPDGRPVKEILQRQVGVEMEDGTGTTVAKRVVWCALQFFGDGQELLGADSKDWKRRVDERYLELAQVEYERELSKTKTGRRYLRSKPQWGMAYWLQRSKGLRAWGRRSSLYRLFQFRCNGHHLRSETSRHKVKGSDGEYRRRRGKNVCKMCNMHKECPARVLFECESTMLLRGKFYEVLQCEAGWTVANELQKLDAQKQWARINEWLDGRGWGGSEEGFDRELDQLVTLVHDVLELRLSAVG